VCEDDTPERPQGNNKRLRRILTVEALHVRSGVRGRWTVGGGLGVLVALCFEGFGGGEFAVNVGAGSRGT